MRFALILSAFILSVLLASGGFVHAATGSALTSAAPLALGHSWTLTALQLAITGTVAILAGAFLLRSTSQL